MVAPPAVVPGVVAAVVASRVTDPTAGLTRVGVVIAASKKATRQHTVTGKRGRGKRDIARQERARQERAGQTDQLPEQPEASCRRARPPSTSPVIAESCGESGRSYALSSDSSTQPLDVESVIARWTIMAYCCFLGPVRIRTHTTVPTSTLEHQRLMTRCLEGRTMQNSSVNLLQVLVAGGFSKLASLGVKARTRLRG